MKKVNGIETRPAKNIMCSVFLCVWQIANTITIDANLYESAIFYYYCFFFYSNSLTFLDRMFLAFFRFSLAIRKQTKNLLFSTCGSRFTMLNRIKLYQQLVLFDSVCFISYSAIRIVRFVSEFGMLLIRIFMVEGIDSIFDLALLPTESPNT